MNESIQRQIRITLTVNPHALKKATLTQTAMLSVNYLPAQQSALCIITSVHVETFCTLIITETCDMFTTIRHACCYLYCTAVT